MGLIEAFRTWRRKRHVMNWEPTLESGEKAIIGIVAELGLNRFAYRYEQLDYRTIYITDRRIVWRIWDNRDGIRTEEVRLDSIVTLSPKKGFFTTKQAIYLQRGGDTVNIEVAGQGQETHVVNLYVGSPEVAGECRRVLTALLSGSESSR